MRYHKLTLGLVLVGLAGCGGESHLISIGGPNGHIGDVSVLKCNQQFGVRGGSFSAQGIEIPLPNNIVPGGIVKVGQINVQAKTLQDASNAVQLLSIAANTSCQAVVAAVGTDAKNKQAAAMNENIDRFQGAMALLNGAANGPAASPQAFQNAVASIQKPVS
jgi:hypothetical protein